MKLKLNSTVKVWITIPKKEKKENGSE